MTYHPTRTIENSITGERATLLATGDQTNGEYVRIRNETIAGSQGVPMHYHTTFTETFTVLEGLLDVCIGSRKHHRVLRKGETVTVPMGTAHRWWNASAEPVVFEVEVSPARNFEQALRAQFGLANDGRTTDQAIPRNIFELALIYELAESYVAGVPLFLQKTIFAVLARVARRIGYDPAFSRYTEREGFGKARR